MSVAINGMSAYDAAEDKAARILRILNEDDEPEGPDERFTSGATFVLDQDASLTPRWGSTHEVLWAMGESLMIVGPPGVGKTTVAMQIVAGLLGITKSAVGYPVEPAKKVLYLAMDRPAQIRRAMRRLFGEEHRDALERLVVWPRPIPSDLGKKPETLLELARLAGCDVVVVDSLKDATVKPSDEEMAGNFNRAVQWCNAEGVDVLVLHHQRKSQGGSKPTSLEDVFGSVWLTAGTGSVVLLWGEAGSELVELTHLKQPADPVGPLSLEHDHHRGTTTISKQWDPLAWLRMRGKGGGTTDEAAQAEHGTTDVSAAKKKKTERKLRKLVQQGLAKKSDQASGSGRFDAVRWWAVETTVDAFLTVDTDRGHDLF